VVEKRPCVYILASQRNGTLCVGVFYEFHETMSDTLTREKRIKKWRRQWKLDLLEQNNPRWRDLYQDLAS
jgi:putative endonuclease